MSKRRCSFANCDSVEGLQHLYSFPAHEPSVCRVWVLRSGNPNLARLPLSSLSRKYACEKHFTPNSFKSSARRYLWPNVKPIYTSDGQLLDGVDEGDERQFVVPRPRKRAKLSIKEIVKNDDSSGEKEFLLTTSMSSEEASLKSAKPKRLKANPGGGRKRLCVFADCDSAEGAQHLFSFPVHEPGVCRLWALRSGNQELVGLPLEYLRRKYACEYHFAANAFISPARKRLRPNVRPVYAADGGLLEGVDECEVEWHYPKRRGRSRGTDAMKARHAKAIRKRLEAKMEHKIPKSCEDSETGVSPDCEPLPAGALLGRIYSENMSDVCCLCLCDNGKVSRSTSVYLKDDYTEGTFSLATLTRELQLNKIIPQNSLELLCELCVGQLSSFYLFKSKCSRLASGLSNLYTFAQSTRDNATVVVPFETVQEYATIDDDFRDHIDEDECEGKIKNEYFTQDELEDKINLRATYKHDLSDNKVYSEADHVANGAHLVNPFKSNATENIKQTDVSRQKKPDKYSILAKCIVQGKSYCRCCLMENEALFEVLETMLFMEAQNEIIPLKDILYGINCYSATEHDSALICCDCLSLTIKAYNFKTMFNKSESVFRDCISVFEAILTNAEKISLSEGVQSLHLNFNVQMNNFIHPKGVELNSNSELERDESGVSVRYKSAKKVDLKSACYICRQEFPSFEEERRHIAENHPHLLFCVYCKKHFESKDETLLKKHTEYCQTVEKPFQCDLCSMKFCRRNLMQSHRKRHFPKTFRCDYCQLELWSQWELNDHNLRMHRELSQPSYECTICHSAFAKWTAMRTHIATHPPDSEHTCKYCGASYKTTDGYYAHSCPGKRISMKLLNTIRNENFDVETHTMAIISDGSASTICDICGRVFTNSANLRIHRRTHLGRDPTSAVRGDKTAMCDSCGLLFQDIDAVTRHLKCCSVYRERQYAIKCAMKTKRIRKVLKCDLCDYKSQLKMCLELHINKYHFKRKPYECSLCDRSYHTTAMLKAHKKMHTDGPDAALICSVCGNQFKYKNCLKYHMRLHTGERPYPCDLCDEKFLSASRRQDHRTRKHFAPTVQCTICSKLCYMRRDLRDHMRKRHKIGLKVKVEEKLEQ